jgi:hypothetical protein
VNEAARRQPADLVMAVESVVSAGPVSVDRRTLRRLWWHWTEVVERYARRRHRRQRVTPQEYSHLHTNLLEACRSLSRGANPGRREFYTTLLNLAQPWCTLHSLEHGDPEILLDLWVHCQHLQRELGGRPLRSRLRGWAGPAAVVLLLVGLGFLGVQTADKVFFPLLSWAKDWMMVVRFTVSRWGQLSVLLGLGAVVTLVAVYLISRARRA